MNKNALISSSMVDIANVVLHASESLGKHDRGAGFDIPECMLQMIEHVSSACVIDIFSLCYEVSCVGLECNE